ncbi:hypothetical protein B9479_006811 [Cryptococcus floricola]|uniref:Uncharacterized protein n=1 Tax=Cryptococcus floricola TaxID=2591691 RepID=A0A5D3AQU5_9TREE|nr:hypothetical protein B9479_006811 [Cryptococcus floricola]
MSQSNNQNLDSSLDQYSNLIESAIRTVMLRSIRTIQNQRDASEDQSAGSRVASSVPPSGDMSVLASIDPNDFGENVAAIVADALHANTPSTVILEDEDLVGDDENTPPAYEFGAANTSATHPTTLEFKFSERQTGIAGDKSVTLCTNTSPQGASCPRWLLDEVERGGRDRQGIRISMDDAITLYLGDLDEDRRGAVSGWMMIGLDQFWSTGQSTFDFRHRGASVDEDAAQN